jgi:hypothetical protein
LKKKSLSIVILSIISILAMFDAAPIAYAESDPGVIIVVKVIHCDGKPVENALVQITKLEEDPPGAKEDLVNLQKFTNANGFVAFYYNTNKLLSPDKFSGRVIACGRGYKLEGTFTGATADILGFYKEIFGLDPPALLKATLEKLSGFEILSLNSVDLVAHYGGRIIRCPCDVVWPPQPDEKSGQTVTGSTTKIEGSAEISCEYKWIDEPWPYDNNWEFKYTVKNLGDKAISDFKICFTKEAENLVEEIEDIAPFGPLGWEYRFDGNCLIFESSAREQDIKPGKTGDFYLWYEDLNRGVVETKVSRWDESNNDHKDDPESIPTVGVIASATSDEVGPVGGIVDDKQGTTVAIPTEALLNLTTIGISHPGSVLLPENAPLGIRIVKTREFTPHWLSFHEPVAITITYLDSEVVGINESTLSAFWLNPDTLHWELIPESTVDTVANMVMFQITHFSTFSIGGQITPVGDIAIANVTPSRTAVRQGSSVNIDVTVENQGDYLETFDVTAYANTTEIETEEITLTSGSSATITFTWDTTGFAAGNYTISAYATPVPGETDTADNTLVDGQVSVTPVSPCCIATAAYSTPMAKEVQILREFRDKYLLTNPPGRAFVDFYYQVSPPMAEFITEHLSLKPLVRAGLLPAVAMSAMAINTTPAEKIAIVGLLALVSVALAVWAKRRRGRGPEYSCR